MSWSAAQYAIFEDERTRPARELLAAVSLRDVRCALDLGCGPGNSTELLAQRFPQSEIVGVDISPDMIAKARARLPAVRFEVADVRDRAAAADLIFANAVLQWLPGHAELLPALLQRLTPGGCIAVQMPDNLDDPAHLRMQRVADDGPWRPKLAGAGEARTPLEPADWYHRLLRASAARVDVWRTTYYHALRGSSAVVEWFKGSGLLPYLAPLDAAERADYLDRYARAIGAVYPEDADGVVLLPFPRLFIVAHANSARYS